MFRLTRVASVCESYSKVQVSGFRTTFLSFSGKMEELKNNPYYAKYAEKFESARKSCPEEFHQKLEELKKKKAEEKRHGGIPAEEGLNSIDTLSSVMNVELLHEKTADEISEIWKDYHTEKNCIFAVIKADEYLDIRQKASKFPNFLYPVPRGSGYEFFIQRWVDDTCHMSPLDSVQKLKDNAPTCLGIRHYTDLIDSKGIVLMRGYPDLKILSVYESQLLALQIKMYYGLHSGLKFNFVRIFNNSPETFRYMDLVAEFENYKMDSLAKKLSEGTPV